MTLAVMFASMLANMIPDGPSGHPAYAQTADSSIEYAENGTAPVGRFRAHDQDGDPIVWSLSGPDAGRFTIGGGVLAFTEPPNYEDLQSATAGAPLAQRNVYRVTVEAAGGTHDVAVTVTNVDEAGTVRMDRPQPQVDRPLGAILSDEDEGVTDERWQWARSADGTTWTDIEGATTPRRRPVPADVGMYLRATVTYSDMFGSGKTAAAVSARRVEARPLSNAAPSFAGQDDDESTRYVDVARSVAENTPVGMVIGRPVSATDADDDVLFYELLHTPDLEDADGRARFTIDSLSGQMRVARDLGADAGEREDEDSTYLPGGPALPESEDAGIAGNSEYVLRVRASDPSTASATVNVIVRVTEVNEAPRFDTDATQNGIQAPPTKLSVTEGDADKGLQAGTPPADLQGNTYVVVDEDAADEIPHLGAYSLEGTDKDSFHISDAGALSVAAAHMPDYEEQTSYSITIVARSGEGSRRLTVSMDVTINVVDAEDVGEVLLSQRQPRVGNQVHATASDPDGGVTITGWMWERSDELILDDGTPPIECRDEPFTPGIGVVEGWTMIDGASSSVYTPQLADVGRCLRATVTYRDNIENADVADEQVTGVSEAPVQSRSPTNTAPRFMDNADRTSRAVAENTEAGRSIGTPVSANDDDGDLLIYTLDGVDAASFDVYRNDGQLRTRVPLDYEAKSRYRVVVTATDPSGATATIPVTINVTDQDDAAWIAGIGSTKYSENGTAPVGRFSAHDQDGDPIVWSLSGPDAGRFTIGGGVLAFREPPNYEDPRFATAGAPLAQRNVYRVTVEAAGGTHDVAVTVTNVDEAGTVRMDRPQPQVDRPLGATLSDEDEGVTDERWQWARSADGTTWTDIEGATTPRRRPVPADVGMYLRATATYSDRFGSGKTAAAVSARRVEARPLSNAAPSFAGQDGDESTPYIDVVRSTTENTPVGVVIGWPVSATDADNDILFYELLHTPDLEDADGRARFTIDSLSGQIRVGRELGADAGEREDEDSTDLSGGPALPESEDAAIAGNSEYVLRVRTSDPSTASATVNVIVRVTEVNEAPLFDEDAPTVLRVAETTGNADPVITFGAGDTPVDAATYAVTDEDGIVTGPDGYKDTSYIYSVSGADSNLLAFNSAGVLSFRAGHKPDFERKSAYSITIVARSGEGPRRLTATLEVAIEVVDAEDVGRVVLSQRQPLVGTEIHATISDPDGGVTITRWVWERSFASAGCQADPGGWTPIAGVSSAVYTPTTADVARCLRATALYTDDMNDAGESATAVLEAPVRGSSPSVTPPVSDGGFVNAAPAFPDQDFSTEGVQSDRTSRTVAENTEAGRGIGAPVSAHDDDGDLLIYTLGGADAASFGIDRSNGQLKTRARLNYEVWNSYTVVVIATDPSGAADSIQVTISVTDEDDPAVITVLDG